MTDKELIAEADGPRWWLFLVNGNEQEIYCDGSAWFYWGSAHRDPPPYHLVGVAPDRPAGRGEGSKYGG